MSGQQEGGRGLQAGFALPYKYPTQANTALEWATRQTIRDQEYTVFVSGTKWTPFGETFTDDKSSNVYYLAAMDGAQEALGYVQGAGPDCGYFWCTITLSYPPATPDDTAKFSHLMMAIGRALGNGSAHEIGHHLERVTPGGNAGFPYMDCGVHKSGFAIACQDNDDFVYNFYDADGLGQDPSDPTSNGGQFFYVDVPGHSIQWGPSNAAWLTKFLPEGW